MFSTARIAGSVAKTKTPEDEDAGTKTPDTHFSSATIADDQRSRRTSGHQEVAFAIAKTDEGGSTFGASMCSYAGSPMGRHGAR